MKKALLAAVAALAAASLACSINLPSIPRVQTGPTETTTVSEPAPEGDAVSEVEINMAAGELSLAGGAEGLAEGTITCNVPDWQPTVRRDGDDLTITQGDGTVNVGLPESGQDIINDWTLKLGDTPMRLVLNAGAYDGTLELGGLALQQLTVHDGASSAKVNFDSLNPEVMSELRYETGASSVTLTGLANANFESLAFTGGAGDYTLDFSGDLQRDAQVKVAAGVSSVKLIVPASAAVTVNVTGGLNRVNTTGGWSQSGDTYTTGGAGPQLSITVEMGVGSLELTAK